ncbi:MAG: hypothetical protein AAF958_11870 [Planctomycetota bacterium]
MRAENSCFALLTFIFAGFLTPVPAVAQTPGGGNPLASPPTGPPVTDPAIPAVSIGGNSIDIGVGGHQIHIPRTGIRTGGTAALPLGDPGRGLSISGVQIPGVQIPGAELSSRVSGARELAAQWTGFATAISAFQRGQYEQSAQLLQQQTAAQTQHLLTTTPAVAMDLAMIEFAAGRFDAAATHAYEAVKANVRWEWPDLRRRYADASDYTTHLRRLQAAVATPGASIHPRFLLAVHHAICGHRDHCLRLLSQLDAELPGDPALLALRKQATTPLLPPPPAEPNAAQTPVR